MALEVLGAISTVTGLLTTIEHVGLRVNSMVKAKKEGLELQRDVQIFQQELASLQDVLGKARNEPYLRDDETFRLVVETFSSAAEQCAKELDDITKAIEEVRPGGESKHPHRDKVVRPFLWPWRSADLQQKALSVPSRLAAIFVLE